MAIIYNYPLNSILLAEDMLIGTSTKIVNGQPKNATKNFSIADLTGFIKQNVSLNDVLLVDNASLLDAKIGKLYLYDTPVTDYGNIVLNQNRFSFNTVTHGEVFRAQRDMFSSFSSSGYRGSFEVSNITANRVWNFPDKSGTVALLSDVPVIGTPTLQEVLTLGGNIAQSIPIILSSTGNDYQLILNESEEADIKFTNLQLNKLTKINSDSIYIGTFDESEYAIINKDGINVDSVNYAFPSGSSSPLATLLDIPSYTTPTLQEVTDEGNTTSNDIIVTDSIDTTTIGKSKITFNNLEIGENLFTNFLYIKGNNGKAIIDTQDLTEDRNFTLPDANGTLALTTDITTPTLQEVTDEGNLTDKSIYVTNALGNYLVLGQEGSTPSLDFGLTIWDITTGAEYSQYFIGRMGYQINGDYYLYLMPDSPYPTGIGIKRLATTDDIIPQVNSDWNATSGVAEILNKPTITDGTVTNVGLTMPSAFSVTNSPITSSGDIAVTGAGLVSQYVRGDGTLANFPNSTGGGSSLSFYLNGSVSQGTIGSIAFREMDKTPILGAGTDFTINANGYIQSFITDAGIPNQLEIPAGNWNFETYFSASSNGGSPSFYVELYKWNGATLSLIASSSANPEFITGGTNTDLYVSALAVPQTTLLATDRLAIRIYVTHSGRTIKLHTEGNHLCQVITTFSTGLTALNGLTAQVQNLAVGTSGTDFAISSVSATHTFNLPTASASNRGALSSTDWSTFNNKQNSSTRKNANNLSNNNINYCGVALGTGISESSAVWTITRLTIATSGSITVATATNVAWTNRESVIYT